jgi:4-hydroxy-tetrahydrodipicolinate reductase
MRIPASVDCGLPETTTPLVDSAFWAEKRAGQKKEKRKTAEKIDFKLCRVSKVINNHPLMSRKIKVAQFGLGPIGQSSIRLLAERKNFEIVGGIDIQPALSGKLVGDVCGLPSLAKAKIYPTFEEMWKKVKPDVIVHTAGSRARITFEQCKPMLQRGLAVVSSCEELLFPAHRAPKETVAIDKLCRKSGGRILGTGVNPGFVLDLLPVCLSGVCRSVRSVYGERVVNASTRRQPLQKKIGSGLEPAEFKRLWSEGKAGHAGFQESLLLIAHSFGWKIGKVTETLEPVIADHDIKTQYFSVKEGLTCGLHQVVKAESNEGHSIHLDLKMYLDARDPHDLVRLESDPPVEAVLNGGVAGDSATVAALINAIPRLLKSPAGVRLMTNIPLAG